MLEFLASGGFKFNDLLSVKRILYLLGYSDVAISQVTAVLYVKQCDHILH